MVVSLLDSGADVSIIDEVPAGPDPNLDANRPHGRAV